MRFNVMSRDGSTVRYSGAPKYNGIFGKPSYIEFSEIASPVPIEWQIGDYVDYTRTGFRYKLYTLPQVAKSARSGEAGDAFVYKNVQFYCATKDLEIALFRDIVQYDNGIHFSSIPNVDTYEDVYGIIDRIQANMDDFAPGQWTIRAMSTSYAEITNLMHEVKAFSLSDGTCMDALNQIYNLWKGISWIYKVENGRHTIVLGRPNLQDASNTTPEFSYGEGNGLKVITRAVSTKNEIATRVYAYGSDRNMPTRYYNNLEPFIKDHESVYIPHLMLPQTDWGRTGGERDARLAFLQSDWSVNTYGLIPKVLRFDGSGGLDEIYPSIEGMTVGDVADEDFPATGWPTSTRIDEIQQVDEPTDDGMHTDDSIRLKQDPIRIKVENPEMTYETKGGQEAVTLGTEAPVVDTASVQTQMNPFDTDGLFDISMGGLKGRVYCDDEGFVLGDYLTEVPKTFIEVYVGGVLQTSKEAKVVSTKMQDDFFFSCDDIKFVTKAKGYLTIYVRVELRTASNTPPLTIKYELAVDDEGDEADTYVDILCEYTIAKTFTVYVPQLGFDLNAAGSSLTDGLATMSMKTGLCAGRDFVVNSAHYDEDTHYWVLECQRQDDTSLMQYFPNSVYYIEEGDRFVFVDIQMPQKYVVAAETRLHQAAYDALGRMCNPVMAYVPEVDSKEVFMASVTLTEGLYMPIYDPDLVDTFIPSEPNVNWILISNVTIAENEDVIPIYGVTLRDEKVESMLQVITGELNETQKRLRDNDVDASRKPAENDPEAVMIPTIVGVKIQADSKMFVSDADGNFDGQTITLTAVTSGINKPLYKWYYKVETLAPVEPEEGEEVPDEPEYEVVEEWVELEEETAQAYIVEADSEIYYQDGRTWEDFKVCVTEGAEETPPDEDVPSVGDGEEPEPEPEPKVYSDTVRISKGGRGPKGIKGDDGSDGLSKATITLYRRFPTGVPSNTRVGDTTYTFSTQMLVGTLNGWSPTPPQGSGPIYVTTTSVASADDTVSIPGGWVTDVPAGAWSVPVRLTGENGLMGKVMRGVNIWEQGGLDGGRPDGTDGYQGLDEVDTAVAFYDVVARVDENGTILAYYYCKDGSDGNAALIAPWEAGGSTYWEEAENFQFIATKVLLADNAFIDILSGNAIYLYDNDGPAGGDIVAGVQGGSEDTLGNPQVNFYAGATNPQEAPFRVYYDGSFVSTEGRIGGYTYNEDGLTYYRNVPGSAQGYHSLYQKDAFEILWRNGYGTNKVSANVVPNSGDPIMSISKGIGSGTALEVAGTTAIDANGDVKVVGGIQRYNLDTSEYEDAITFDQYNSSQGLDSILRVVHCTQQDYDYYEANNLLDDNTWYIITE